MEKTELRKVEVSQYYCDYCNEEITSMYSSSRCYYCFRDICPKHSVENPLSDNSGDRINYVCVECFEIMKPFVKKIKHIQEKSDSEIEKLESELKSKCKQSKLNKKKEVIDHEEPKNP